MQAQELLGMLTARVQRFHMAPGGIPVLTCNDISQALGLIRVHDVALYGRVKYCGQVELAEDCAKAIRRSIMYKKANSHWRNPRPDFSNENLLSCT